MLESSPDEPNFLLEKMTSFSSDLKMFLEKFKFLNIKKSFESL